MLSWLVWRKRSSGKLTPPRAIIQCSRSQCASLRHDETHSPHPQLEDSSAYRQPSRRVGRRTEVQRIAIPGYTASLKVKVKVLGWKKGERSGMVVHGARGRDGRARGGAVRVGGHVPWGAKVEYAFRAGYDGNGKVSVDHVVAPRYSALLKQPEPATT